MKTSATIFVLLLAGGSAMAQDERSTRDYSRDTLLRLFYEAGDEDERPIRYRNGAVEFHALGTSWAFNYQPMMPLSGSVLTTQGRGLPDPFALTGTVIATSPRAWRTRREVSVELKRIEALERAKVKVTVGEQ